MCSVHNAHLQPNWQFSTCFQKLVIFQVNPGSKGADASAINGADAGTDVDGDADKNVDVKKILKTEEKVEITSEK
jgi:hypothetical protein